MENVTAYDIALIGGGFAVVGALIGALSAYWLATELARVKEYRAACVRLRAAFAPALAMIYLARHHGNHDRPNDHGFIQTELLRHAAAVEEFRVFVPDSKRSAYQETWESYRKDAHQDGYSRIGDEWGRAADTGREVPHGEIIEEKIHALLRFTET